MRVLLLDNIDSFTWNIFHYLEALGVAVEVIDHHTIELHTVAIYDAVVLSPGPGVPAEAGKLMEVIREAVHRSIPVLGVCLGMQAIAEFFGGSIYNRKLVMHGQQVKIRHNKSAIFRDLPDTYHVGLYHSWAVSEVLPEVLKSTAHSDDGVMMALEHTQMPVYGVQFHPESILSEYGMELFENFLAIITAWKPSK